jgi:hypothetical protein
MPFFGFSRKIGKILKKTQGSRMKMSFFKKPNSQKKGLKTSRKTAGGIISPGRKFGLIVATPQANGWKFKICQHAIFANSLKNGKKPIKTRGRRVKKWI